jgi:hypothetical protein
MSSSFGNNKRKPGATAGAVTEAKRRATLAANWDDYSKQRKVPSESIVPSIMGRNAGIQSIFYAQNNGSNPYVPPITPPPYGSLYFDGSGFVTVPFTNLGIYNANSVLTIDWFQKMTTVPADSGAPAFPRPWCFGNAANGPLSVSIEGSSSTSSIVRVFSRSSPTVTAVVNSPPVPNTVLKDWCHFALVKYGTTYRVFLNGQSIMDGTIFPTLADNGGNNDNLAIGNYETSSVYNAKFNGYITNFRWLSGFALYPDISTLVIPPLPLVNIPTYTKLLLNVISDSTKYVDTTGQNTLTTVNIPPIYSIENTTEPAGSLLFDVPSVYTPTNYTRLMTQYSSTNLVIPAATAAQFFTIEWFQYMTQVPSDPGATPYPRVFSAGAYNDNGAGWNGPSIGISIEGANNQFYFWQNDNGASVSGPINPNLLKNTWAHVAICGYGNATAPAGGKFCIFLNGKLVLTGALTASGLHPDSSFLGIGNEGNPTALIQTTQFHGYITGFRWVVNGTGGSINALYPYNATVGTQVFTPPSYPLQKVANTQLLMNSLTDATKLVDSANNYPVLPDAVGLPPASWNSQYPPQL